MRRGEKVRPCLVLCDPDGSGTVLLVPFTDAGVVPYGTDLWKQNMTITPEFNLVKDSKLNVAYAFAIHADELDGTPSKGVCSASLLQKAWCCICNWKQLLNPHARAYFSIYEADRCVDC